MPRRPKKPETDPDQVRLKPKQRAFLAAFAVTGSIRKSAEAAGIERHNHAYWMSHSSLYAAAFAKAQEAAIQDLEDEVRRRAYEGVRKPVLWKGQPVMDPATGVRDPITGTIDPRTQQFLYEHEYSDDLLKFYLRALKPEKYRDNLNLSGSIDSDLSVTHELRQQVLNNPAAVEALTRAITAQ